jgi:motility quorum-sensing regulator / GCU-specific mRNA interferase toxin
VRPHPSTIQEDNGEQALQYWQKATFDLEKVKGLITTGRCRITKKAFDCAVELGYATKREVENRVLGLSRTDIVKTMTTDADNKIWQDVYKSKEDDEVELYIKIQISKEEEAVIISFKPFD